MPTAPTEFTMNADVLDLLPDSADSGPDLDISGLAGLQIYFDANVASGTLLQADITPRPVLLKPERITGYIRSNGRMYDQLATSVAPADLTDPGNIGVRMLANGAELNLETALSYKVSTNRVVLPNGKKWALVPYSVPVPSTDTTVDLGNLAPVAGSTVVGIPDLGNVDDLNDMTTVGKAVARAVDQAAARAAIGVTTGGGTEWEEYANLAAFPGTGDTTKEYLAQDTGNLYRWNGSTYTEISVGEPPITGTTSADYWRGDKTFHTLNQDAVPDGTTNKAYSATDKTRLASTSGTNTGDQTSVTGNAGTATKLATARNIDGQAFDGSADVTVIAPGTHAATGKTTPVDADELSLVDSAASNGLKKLTWANLKATVKSYYDSVVSAPTNKDLTSGTNTFPTLNQSTTGNAATATKLATARNINGQPFDGTADLVLGAAAAITTATTPTMGQANRYNASAGVLANTLPALSGVTVGAYTILEKDALDTTANTVTFTAAGADTFDDTATSFSLKVPGEKRTLQVVSISGTKYWKSIGGVNPVTATDRRYGLGDAFNWQSSNTRRLQRSLGAALAGTGYSDHLIIGDSTSASYTGTTTFPSMWPRIMRAQMTNRGIPLGGTGWVLTTDYTTEGPDPRWTHTGTWTNGNNGFQYTTTNGATQTFTSDVPGTAISFAYFNNSGAFTITVDGGSPVTVTPTATNTVAIYTASGLANTTHTITFTTTTTSITSVVAAQCYNPSGLRVHNLAFSGTNATDALWTTNTYNHLIWMITSGLLASPDVLHIALGVNDLNNGHTSSAVVAALTSIRGFFSSADVILYGQYQPSGTTTANWAAYIQALYQLAVTFNCPLVDLYQRSGGYTNANSLGMMGDGTHPSKAAQADWGLLVTDLLLKAA
jgi:lysophospholipase L1-like esterase